MFIILLTIGQLNADVMESIEQRALFHAWCGYGDREYYFALADETRYWIDRNKPDRKQRWPSPIGVLIVDLRMDQDFGQWWGVWVPWPEEWQAFDRIVFPNGRPGYDP